MECLAIKEAIKYWLYWLIECPFIMFSDHKPLQNLRVSSVRTDEELDDMTNFLVQSDFNIKYKPGKENEEADCLSCNPVMEVKVKVNVQ